jgi:hypothetical protein
MHGGPTPGGIAVPISPGELIDKITILEIKRIRIADAAKRVNVNRELALLTSARDTAIAPSQALDSLADALRTINGRLWDIEDAIRRHERAGDFGPGFTALARAVYQTNDRRAAIKRQINDLLDAAIVEEKSYAAY